MNECFKSEIDILLLELNKILYASYSYEVKLELQINNESNKFLNKMILVDKFKQFLNFCIYQ